ncbi:MAG: phospholipase [Deltaproteobacteria bacterium]|nr:phospholipase [Deltaproteobacteria bacterium]
MTSSTPRTGSRQEPGQAEASGPHRAFRPAIALPLAALLLGLGVIAWHGRLKPLPPGLSVQTPTRPVDDAHFLTDLTYVDTTGTRRVEQRIFDAILETIHAARRQIVLDMFLFNEFQGEHVEETRALCEELTRALVDRKRAHPDIEIVLITDPINTVYGAITAPHLDRLRAVGISVVMTDLDPLRDSNWLYSSLWRWFIQPWGGESPGRLPNPFGGEDVSLQAGLRLLNFKANHRKTLVADSPSGWTGLVTSANPHDASSAHGNLAIRFSGPAVADLLETERAIAAFSGAPVPRPIEPPPPRSGRVRLRILTEGKIGAQLDTTLDEAQPGDELAIAVFYLADRGIIRRILSAHQRGVSIRVLLDPNKDAFGREKNGLPNRPVAAELQRAGIPVRWCDTHGEQCHAKMLLLRHRDESILIAGSANFTRRNLRDFNLETDIWLRGQSDARVLREAWSYFERVWQNEPGRRYSTAYEAYADESWSKWWLYQLSELSGVGTQ